MDKRYFAQFEEDIKKAREECEKAGVGWPGWYWSDGVELTGHFVLFDGDLYKVMAETAGGYFADRVFYNPNSKRADENGFVHNFGLPIPKAYDPFKVYYCEKAQNQNGSSIYPKYEQMSLFDFYG